MNWKQKRYIAKEWAKWYGIPIKWFYSSKKIWKLIEHKQTHGTVPKHTIEGEVNEYTDTKEKIYKEVG